VKRGCSHRRASRNALRWHDRAVPEFRDIPAIIDSVTFRLSTLATLASMFVPLALIPATAQTQSAQKLTSKPLQNPTATGSLQPHWSAAADGTAVLSWIEPTKDNSFALRYATLKGSVWSDVHTVADHRHFFRHPAEAPEVIQTTDKKWMAHWVEMPSETSEAEFLYVSSSADGVHWTAPLMAHKDRSQVEHGLASMVESGTGESSLIWLEMPKGEDGPTYLMRTVLDASGKEVKEERLDLDVCSCCPTAVVKTAKGLLIAYRDHTPADIRDISVISFENGQWSQPKNVHADNWKINACPTNAAAIAAKGSHVAIAWYTGAQNSPKVEMVFSEDSGSTFSKPVVVSTGHAFGYTSLVLDEDGGAIVSWLERKNDELTSVLARKITASGVAQPVVEVAQGEQQGLGYPRLVHAGNSTFIAWGKPGSKLQTAALQN